MHVQGTLEDLAREAKLEDGKILNALDLPMAGRGHVPAHQIATDRVAFHSTIDRAAGYPRATDNFPNESEWGLGATGGTVHPRHVDAEGTGTEVDIKNKEGKKVWIIFTPKPGARSAADADYYKGEYDPWKAVLEGTIAEAVVMKYGNRL